MFQSFLKCLLCLCYVFNLHNYVTILERVNFTLWIITNIFMNYYQYIYELLSIYLWIITNIFFRDFVLLFKFFFYKLCSNFHDFRFTKCRLLLFETFEFFILSLVKTFFYATDTSSIYNSVDEACIEQP